jgi:exosortase K
MQLARMNMGGLEQTARRKLIVQLILVLSAAAALKLFYSQSSVNDLRWVLAPTATLVELITGVYFEFEPYAGYMSAGRTFLIAAACAGVNFLIAAFLMLSLRKLWKERAHSVSWKYFVFAAAASYVATVIANTTRIAIAVWLNSLDGSDWLEREQIHRFEGIIVYFGFLLLLFILAEKADSTSSLELGHRSRGFGSIAFPLIIYYTTTIGIPLTNGAYRQGDEFWRHTAVVFLIPLIIIAVVVILRLIKDQEPR